MKQRSADTALTAEEVARLLGAKRTGEGQWSACCPAHNDTKESLSISRGKTQPLLLKCHAGCKYEEITVKIRELIAARGTGKVVNFPKKESKTGKAARSTTLGTLVDHYDYYNEDCSHEFRVCRYANPKAFRQCRRDELNPGKWIWNISDVRKVPYCLPRLLKVEPSAEILLCEGEKDVRKLWELGFPATTTAGGAAAWEHSAREISKALLHRRVVILPDNDAAGRGYAQAAIDTLAEVAADVRVLELPGLPEKGDVSDWIAAGGTAEQLRELLKSAVGWRKWSAVQVDAATKEPIEAEQDADEVVIGIDSEEEPQSEDSLSDSPFAKIQSLGILGWLDKPIPERDYLLTSGGVGFMPAHIVGFLLGAGGLGKSYALLSLALAVATGRMWLGTYPVKKSGAVAILAGEEDEAELWRRMISVVKLMKLSKEHTALAESRIFPLPLHGVPVQLQKGTEANGLPGDNYFDLEKQLAGMGVEWSLIIIDPASRFGSMDLEKDNATATRFIQMLENLAKLPGRPTIIVAHHTNKASRLERGTATSARGASGLTDGARWVANLDPVPKKSNDPDAPRLVALHVTKANNVGIHGELVLINDPNFDGALRPATTEEKSKDARAAEAHGVDLEEVKNAKIDQAILAALARGPQTNTQLRHLGGNHKKVQERLFVLEEEKIIQRDSPKKPWRLVTIAPDAACQG